MAKEVKKIVLAYSGGLDTSVILKWLQETYEAEHRERQVRNLLRRARDLGFSLVAQEQEQEVVTR